MEKWQQIEIKKRVEKMKRAIDPALPVWILMQNDPDPDAIASAMALQTILGRTDKTAPLVTLKQVSRTENQNMIKIIGIKVGLVTESQVVRAPQLAMVDVQPAFFRRDFTNLKVVVDHHPVTQDYSAPYIDVQEEYGSTSSIFTEYIVASEIKINERLGSALYYGVKTDTLLFGRGVSGADFSAFALLWPIANHHLIMQMERPRLRSEEVNVFIKALKGHILKKKCLFVGLGAIPKEDLVPRLADFVLQIGEPEFALVWGNIGRETTFSARSLSPLVNAGEVMSNCFGEIGSAGGHASMARATVDNNELKKHFNTKSMREAKELLIDRIIQLVASQKRKNSRK